MYWNYISCLLTIVSTVMVGKRLWHGWMLAGLNSIIICLIGFQTKQWGFIPANIFCLVLYARNIRKWRGAETAAADVPLPVAETPVAAAVPQVHATDRALPIVLAFKAPLEEKPRRFRRRGFVSGAEFHRFRQQASTKHRATQEIHSR